MEIDIDVYFWMVDRGVFEFDDQRNKVDIDRNKVKLHREFSSKFDNAIYISKLMLILKKSVVKISKKPFSLDPNLQNLKDNPTSIAKQTNWNLVAKELKKFGIRVDGDKKQKIIEGRYQYVCDILNKLFDFDNGGGVHSQRFQDGNNSEINYVGETGDNSFIAGNMSNEPLREDQMNSSIGEIRQKRVEQGQILLGAPLKKAVLDPIVNNSLSKSPSKQVSAVTSIQKLSQVSSLQQLSSNASQNFDNLQKLDQSKDTSEAQSTLEFILFSLAKGLGIKPKQAAGLLSNNMKYLIHIAVKGMKGGDFSKMLSWYTDVFANSKLLLSLIEQEKEANAMANTLNIVKCGLFSSNLDICIACSRVLTKMGQDINEYNAVNDGGGELSGLAWDWFVNNKAGVGMMGNEGGLDNNSFGLGIPSLDDVKVPDLVPTPEKDQAEFGESGLAACVYAMKRHPIDYLEHALSVMVQFGKNNYFELFSHQILAYYSSRSDYLSLCHDLFQALNGEAATSISKEVLIYSGVIDNWLDLAIRYSDFDGQNQPNDRIAALSLLSSVWEGCTGKIEEKGDVAQAILTMLKRGCRDKSKLLRISSCELMFKLLHNFAVDRNPFAPILYKSLTFLLIEFHSEIQIREQMLKHFTTLFCQVQSIPVSILCEPFLKQIQINDVQLTPFQFNTFDYEFFWCVVNHKRANVATAIQIGEEMVKVAASDIFFRNGAISIIISIILRFNKDPSMHSTFSQIFKQVLNILEQTEKQKSTASDEAKKKRNQQQYQNQNNQGTLRASLSPYKLKKIQEQEKQKQMEDDQASEALSLARQTKERLIVNMFKKIILSLQQQKGRAGGVEMILQDLRMQLLNLYTTIEKSIKVKSRAINHLLSLFGDDVPKMLQYFIDIELPSIQLKQQEDQQIYQEQIQKDFLGDGQEGSINQDSLNSRDIQMMQIVPYSQETSVQSKNNLTRLQEQALKDIDKIRSQKMARTERKTLEEELKRMVQEKQLQQAKKAVEQRKMEHGVASKVQQPRRGISEDQQQSTFNQREGDVSIGDIIIRRVKDDEFNDYGQNDQSQMHTEQDDQQRLFTSLDEREDMNMVVALPNQNAKKKNMYKPDQIKLYDIRIEEQKDQDAVRFFLKKNLKILKALFVKYQNSGPLQNNNVSITFDKLQAKNNIITSAEILKFLKDYQITNVQMSKDDVIGYMRLINMDILKKPKQNQAKNIQSSSLQMLDFEGFVEFILQLAVHLYSFNDDHPPVEYLLKLFDHMKKVAIMTGNNQSKMFEDNQFAQKVWGLGGSAQTDAKLLSELQKRVDQQKDYKLPEGYTKAVEKEIISTYKVPDSLVKSGMIQESQLIALEVLDQIIYEQYKVHFLEPMSEVKTSFIVRANPKQQANDPTLFSNEQQNQQKTLKGYVKATTDTQATPIRARQKRAQLSSSVDNEPINNRNRNMKSLSQRTLSPMASVGGGVKEVKPLLGVNLKIEVAKAPQNKRGLVLETAYVLEEMLIAVEQGLDALPDRQQLIKQKIVNKVLQERLIKEQEEIRFKKQSNQKLQQRKELLKGQLDKMKDEKSQKIQEAEEKSKKKREEEMASQKKKDQAKKVFLQQMAAESDKKRKQREEEEQKKRTEKEEQDKKGEEEKKQQLKVIMKEKKSRMSENFKKKQEDRNKELNEKEEEQKKKDNKSKQKDEQVKQKYSDNLQKARENKEKQRQAYYDYIDQQMVADLLSKYDKSLNQMFDSYCRFDKPVTGKLSYKSYIQMGNKSFITPQILSSQDFLYVFKTIMRAKKDLQGMLFEQNGTIDIDYESSKLDYQEFKEAIIKIACLAKKKLGVAQQKEEEEQQQQKGKIGVEYERQFDYMDMTEKTLLELFKLLGLKVIRGDNNKVKTINSKSNNGVTNNDLDNLDDEL